MSDEKKTPPHDLPWLKNNHQAKFLFSKARGRSVQAQSLKLSEFAQILWSQQDFKESLEVAASRFLAATPGLTSTEAVLENTGKILATFVSTSEKIWQCVEKYYRNHAELCVHASPHKTLKPRFEPYRDFMQMYSHLSESELLIILHGAQENVLKISLVVNDYDLINLLCDTFITTTDSALVFHLSVAIAEAYHHFLAPAMTAVLLEARFSELNQDALDDLNLIFRGFITQPSINIQSLCVLRTLSETTSKAFVVKANGQVINLDDIHDNTIENFWSQIAQHPIDGIAILQGQNAESWHQKLKATRKTALPLFYLAKPPIFPHALATKASQQKPPLDVGDLESITATHYFMNPLVCLKTWDPLEIKLGMSQHNVDSQILRRKLLETSTEVEKNPPPTVNLSDILLTPPAPQLRDLKPGMTAKARVCGLMDLGVVVDLGLAHTGFVHRSKMPPHLAHNLYTKFHMGDKIDVRVIKIEIEKSRIYLGLARESTQATPQRRDDFRRAPQTQDRRFSHTKTERPHRSEPKKTFGTLGDQFKNLLKKD